MGIYFTIGGALLILLALLYYPVMHLLLKFIFSNNEEMVQFAKNKISLKNAVDTFLGLPPKAKLKTTYFFLIELVGVAAAFVLLWPIILIGFLISAVHAKYILVPNYLKRRNALMEEIAKNV